MRLKTIYIIIILELLYAHQQTCARQNTIDSLLHAAAISTSFEQKLLTVTAIQTYITYNPHEKALLDTLCNILDHMNADAVANNNDRNLAEIWLLRSIYFYSNLELDSSIKYATAAEEYYLSVNDTSGLLKCYNFLWSSHRRLNHFNTSLRYFFKSKEIFEVQKDTSGIISSYFSLGIMYLNKEREPLKAIEALRKTNQYGDEIEPLVYCNIAKAYLLLHQADSAAKYLKLGQSLAQSKIVFQTPYYYRALAKYYKYTGQLDSAIVNFHKAIDGLEVAKQNHNQSKCYYYLGEIAFTRNEYIQAETYYRKAEAIAKRFLYAELPDIYLGLNKLYENRTRIAEAYQALQQYQLAEDSLKKTETTDILLSNDLQHEFTLRENEMKKEQLKKEFEKQVLEKQQKQTKIIGSVIILFLLIIALLIYRSNKIIFKEKQRSDELLLNILPSEVAEELKTKGSADAKQFDEVTVMFTDFKNFTQISEKLSPTELVAEIHTCFKAFDGIIEKHNIEKIKTIGDSYMCAGGLPVMNKTNAEDIVKAALEIQEYMNMPHDTDVLSSGEVSPSGRFRGAVRIGIHTGPVVAGIVGVKKFAYDIWGDTVNIASRMESSGEAGKVNISGSTYELVKDKFSCDHRGKITAKNKGEIDMYFVSRSFV